MIEIISFPLNDGAARSHRKMLQSCGRSFWSGLSVSHYLNVAGEPFSPPDLAIVDHTKLDGLGELSRMHNHLKFLKRIPTLVIFGDRKEPELPTFCGMNVIGFIPRAEQGNAAYYLKMIKAFYKAKENVGGTSLTRKAFEQARAHFEPISQSRVIGTPLMLLRTYHSAPLL